MCRITIFIPKEERTAKIARAEVGIVTNILLTNANHSNRDGVGFFITRKNQLFKSATSAHKIIGDVDLIKWLWANYKTSIPIIAHVRQATVGGKGANKDHNAHPFVSKSGRFVVAHNGTFYNWAEAQKKWKISPELEVDSAIFTEVLDQIVLAKGGQFDPLVDIQKAIDEFEGSFALAVYDTLEDKIYAATGINDLNLYENNNYIIINTDGALVDEINLAVWHASLVTEYFHQIIKSSKLESKTLFLIDKTGATKLGNLTAHAAVVQTATYNYENWRENWAARLTTKPVTTKELTTSILDLNSLIDSFFSYKKVLATLGAEEYGIIELLRSLQEFFPTEPCELSREDWDRLSDFIAYLVKNKVLDLSENLTKYNLWTQIVELSSRAKVYPTRHWVEKEFKISLVEPFFMNDIDALQSIVNFGRG